MKLADIVRRTVLAITLGSSLVLAAGCPAGGGPPPPPVVQPPTDADPLLTTDGRHFAAVRTYKGECMPAQSRGGCYSVTLQPDGQFRNVLLDAAIIGTYVIDGNAVHLTPSGAAPPSTMTLSADRNRLDDFVYEPSVE